MQHLIRRRNRSNAHVRPCYEARGLVGLEALDGAGACEGLCRHPDGREMRLGELWGGCAACFVLLVDEREISNKRLSRAQAFYDSKRIAGRCEIWRDQSRQW